MTIEQNGYKRSTGIWYWITTALLAFILISGGMWLMAGTQPMDAYLGFPADLRLLEDSGRNRHSCPPVSFAKEWAYAGIVFNMAGASAARVFVGDAAGHIIAPLVICGSHPGICGLNHERQNHLNQSINQ